MLKRSSAHTRFDSEDIRGAVLGSTAGLFRAPLGDGVGERDILIPDSVVVRLWPFPSDAPVTAVKSMGVTTVVSMRLCAIAACIGSAAANAHSSSSTSVRHAWGSWRVSQFKSTSGQECPSPHVALGSGACTTAYQAMLAAHAISQDGITPQSCSGKSGFVVRIALL